MHAFIKSAREIAEDGKFDSFAGVMTNAELNEFFHDDRVAAGEILSMSTSVSASPSLTGSGRSCCSGWRGSPPPWATRCWPLTIGWQVYELTDSAFDLGLVGLIQFVPAVVLTLLIGHAADRYDRRLIVRIAQGVYALAAVMITVALLAGVLDPRPAVRRGVPDRLRARLRIADRAFAGAGAGAGADDRARGGGLDLRQPGRGDLRPGAGRADLYGEPDAGQRHLPGVFQRAPSRSSPSSAPKARPPTASRRPSPRCSPASNISARGAGCSASSRSICSWCCSAAPPRCCRSTPAIF